MTAPLPQTFSLAQIAAALKAVGVPIKSQVGQLGATLPDGTDPATVVQIESLQIGYTADSSSVMMQANYRLPILGGLVTVSRQFPVS